MVEVTNNKRFRLTLVCTTLNSERFLRGFLENVNSFTIAKEVKLVLVMNDPTIEETNILNNVQECLYEIQVLEVRKESISKSLNRGFALAESDFIAYLDVDDRHPEDAYERMIATLKDADVTYGDYIIVDGVGKIAGNYVCVPQFSKEIGVARPIFGPTHCFRRTALTLIGYWDEQLRSVGDFEWQIRAASNLRVKKTEGIISYYTNVTDSASKSKWHKVENLVLGLRYGQLDKIGPYIECIDFLSDYKLAHIENFGNLTSVAKFRETERIELSEMLEGLASVIGLKRLSKLLALSLKFRLLRMLG